MIGMWILAYLCVCVGVCVCGVSVVCGGGCVHVRACGGMYIRMHGRVVDM